MLKWLKVSQDASIFLDFASHGSKKWQKFNKAKTSLSVFWFSIFRTATREHIYMESIHEFLVLNAFIWLVAAIWTILWCRASCLSHNRSNTWYSARYSLGVFIMWWPQLVGRNVNTNHFVFSYARYYTSQAEFQTSAASRLARLFSYNWSQGGLYQTKYNTVLLSAHASQPATKNLHWSLHLHI